MRYWITFGRIKGRINATVRCDDGLLVQKSFTDQDKATDWANKTKARFEAEGAKSLEKTDALLEKHRSPKKRDH